MSVNDTLIEDLMNSNWKMPRDASYQVDQVSIDFDDSGVVYIDEDSLSSADEAIEPASTKESVATAQKDFAEEHETLKLDAKVNANENTMTSLQSEENEGNNIETVDSRLGGVNDNIEAVSKVPIEIEYIETEECTDFAGNASVELSQNEDSKVDVDRTTLDERSSKPSEMDDRKTDTETSQAQREQPKASIEQLSENQVNSNEQDSPPKRTSPHRPRDVGRSQKMFSGTRFLKLLASPKIISEDATEAVTSED